MGSAENLAQAATIAARWRAMSPEQRQPFEAEARRLETARCQLKGKVLDSTSSATDEAAQNGVLSVPQVKRLSASRLDKTLAQVSGHDVWQGGLGIADHISGLRARLVKPVPDVEAMRGIKRDYDEAFAYDSRIVPNPNQMPKFIRPCCALHGGICEHDPHFDHVVSVLSQFQRLLVGQQLGGSPCLVELQPDDQEAIWVIVATVALRPLCHVILHLHSQGDYLRPSLQNGVPHIGTVHRLLRKVFHVASRAAVPPSDLIFMVA